MRLHCSLPIAGSIAAVVLSVGLALPAAAQTTTLRFGQIPSTVRNVTSIYHHIAKDKGFLARAGIDLQFVSIEGAPTRWWRRSTAARSTSPTPPRPT
jgi:ABC-type nitrate/sulfonate/bicarbonate transport system substrate-binding protein